MNQPSDNLALMTQASNLASRKHIAKIWEIGFLLSTLIGMIALVVLIATIVNQVFGYVAVKNKVDPLSLSSQPLDQLDKDELIDILMNNMKPSRLRTLEREKPLIERNRGELLDLVVEKVIDPTILQSWNLVESLTSHQSIVEVISTDYPGSALQFHSWISEDFLLKSMSSRPEMAGIRSALLGSLFLIVVTIFFAFPLGIGAAIYLEEYAQRDHWFNRLIQVNIDNLAGVPSIVYGILGLAIFVRTFSQITSGNIFGYQGENGRTILSAGLTMGLLVLPMLIINAREALRTVPDSLRQASFGLGATKWQTIWYHVIPQALPGILTGTILSISRAIGETAPLILVGASTFITSDPKNIFSGFTALPIQIYNWTTRPQPAFRNIAAAAILVLLVTLLTLNSAAILLRNHYTKRMH